MAYSTTAQVRNLAQPLRETKSSDGVTYVVTDAVVTAHITNADTTLNGRFRRHYDVAAAAFGTDPVIVLLSAQLAAAAVLRDTQGQQGNKNTLADDLQEIADDTIRRVLAPTAEDERITLTVLRRSDNPEGSAFESSYSTTAHTTAQFAPAGASMQTF